MAAKTQIVLRWDEGALDESLPAYRAFTRDTGEFVGGGWGDLERTLSYWSTFSEYEVVDVESFDIDDERAVWAERVAVRTIGKFLANPRHVGDVYTLARRLLAQLAEAGVKVDLDRERGRGG
jgi:hypothetical protein